MSGIDEISARLTVLETIMKQLITHMAVRDDDPPRWVRTRKTLALSAIDTNGLDDTALLHDAVSDFFHQAEMVAVRYMYTEKPGTMRPTMR
jgi:hypothetical protein